MDTDEVISSEVGVVDQAFEEQPVVASEAVVHDGIPPDMLIFAKCVGIPLELAVP